MAETKPTVTLKDGTKITLDDPSQIAQYSNREDLESITFGGDNDPPLADIKESAIPAPAPPAALINATLSIDTNPQQTTAIVEQPKADPAVPKPAPAGDSSTTITLAISMVAGAASSAGMPMLTNLAKSFLKNKLKGKKSGEPKEEEQEEPTDCKTHQIKSNAKLAKMAARIAALEGKSQEQSKLLGGGGNPLEDLEERIEKLEKELKKTKGKKK